MSNAGYPPPTTFRPRHRPPPALPPALLLIAAGMLAIASSFLTIVQVTDRTLNGGYFGRDPHATVDVTTSTAWSVTSTVPTSHPVQPIDGLGFVLAGTVAMVAAVLILAGRGRWPWTKPLAGLASGLVVGVVLAAVLGFADAMSTGYADKDETVDVSAGPAVWLQIPACLLAIVVAVLAMSGRRRPAPGP